ncbi:MAG TPA: choice-of-anchor D domain-containing protein, partial [Kofleriaceae bacterium]|nr:choice-of-anchor D domain-containing protein [Kofleriaceae bacterium]
MADLPERLDLGDGDCGGTASATFQLANTGAAQLTFDFGASDPRLAVSPRTGALAPGAALSVQVTAEVPAEVGAGEQLVSALVVTTNAGAPRAIPISLRTRGAQITIDPPVIGFGQVAVGFPSTRAFTVRNVGNAAATVTIAAPGGEFRSQFGGAGAVVLAPGG